MNNGVFSWNFQDDHPHPGIYLESCADPAAGKFPSAAAAYVLSWDSSFIAFGPQP